MVLTITIDVSEIPNNLRTKALSLLVSGSSSYTITVETPGVSISSNLQSGLINLQWDIEEPKQKNLAIASTENQEASKISCYPNPVNNLLNIKLENIEGNSTIKIFDITGKQRFFTELHSQNDLLILNKNELKLTSGIYFLQFTENAKTCTKKILVK